MVRPVRQEDVLFGKKKWFSAFLQLRVNLADGAVIRKRLKLPRSISDEIPFRHTGRPTAHRKEKGPFLKNRMLRTDRDSDSRRGR